MKTILSVVICTSFIILAGSQAANVKQVFYYLEQERPLRSPFRYIIVRNLTNSEEYKSNPRSGYRKVEVYMDDKAFSEDKLRILFKLISTRFPTPFVLHVSVLTNLEDVRTPEENDMGAIFETPANASEDKYHKAYFLRDLSGNEWFTYNPSPPSRETKLVVIKGIGPYSEKK